MSRTTRTPYFVNARAVHQSLQEYLRSRLIAEASQPTIDEVLDRASGRTGGSLPLTDAVGALRFDRAPSLRNG